MTGPKPFHSGFAWLEVLCILALLALVLQLTPSVWEGLLSALDIRNWSRAVWITVNAVLLVALVTMRFGSDLYHDWRDHSEHLRVERERREKWLKRQEQRKAVARIKESQKRGA